MQHGGVSPLSFLDRVFSTSVQYDSTDSGVDKVDKARACCALHCLHGLPSPRQHQKRAGMPRLQGLFAASGLGPPQGDRRR